jgi:SAM-dependent methyltransferase
MRQNIKDFIELASKTLPIVEPIYEFGSLQVPEQLGFADLRPYFSGKEYVGCDMRKGSGVDRILNLHDIELDPESVGTVICMETLEHVENPYQAVNEIYRILKTNGIAIISSTMNANIHNHPSDYWRFTPEGFKVILKPFPATFIGTQGYLKNPHTIIGLGFKGIVPSLVDFNLRYAEWKYNDNIIIYYNLLKIYLRQFLRIIFHLT